MQVVPHLETNKTRRRMLQRLTASSFCVSSHRTISNYTSQAAVPKYPRLGVAVTVLPGSRASTLDGMPGCAREASCPC